MKRELPGVLAEIAEVAGEAAALKISALHGGQRVYFPARQQGDDHWLVAAVGAEAAAKIAARFGGSNIDIPLHVGGTYRRFVRQIAKRIHALDSDDLSSREIAGKLGLTQRTVHRHRSRHRGKPDNDQGSLF